LNRIEREDFEIFLNDNDEEALAFSLAKLKQLGDRIRTVHGNVFRNRNLLRDLGKFDLVLAGGLFDYLNERQATFLIKIGIDKLLDSSGIFAFTNIAKPNPYRIWMEYCANWQLIERSERDLDDLLRGITSAVCAKFTVDKTEMTHLIEIRRQPWEICGRQS